MPELTINVPSYIGESYLQVDALGFCEWVQGITWADIEMQLYWAEAIGEPADSILLSFGACDGGSTMEGFNIINKLRALGLPIRSHISGYAASMGVPLALAADEAPTMDYTAQMMFHAASFSNGTWAETSKDLRAAATQLDNSNQLLLDYMSAATGQTPDVVTEWMSKDTWFTATQAQAVGLCGTVTPLAAKTSTKAAEALITARRTKTAVAVARATKHALATRPALQPKAKNAARAAAQTPRPMAKKVTTLGKTAAKTVALPAATAAKIAAVKAFAAEMGVNITAEGDTEVPEAVAEATVLAGEDGTLYTDGPLAVDSAVFNDEALTVVTADNDYEAADGRTITVAGGIVTAIMEADAETEAADSTAAITAAITAALAPITAELATMKATFNKAVPPVPRAKSASAQMPDVKTPIPKAKAAHHEQL